MKTFIIQLEQHDDVVSIRDKMSWAKSPRILLVVPSHRKVDIRPLDVTLLKRHAMSLGAQLGVASRSGELRRSAAEAGVSAFKTTSEAQSEVWVGQANEHAFGSKKHKRKGRPDIQKLKEEYLLPEQLWLKNPSTRIWIFTAGVLAVLLFFVLMLPSARIKIRPDILPQSITFPIVADPDVAAINISGVVPAYPIEVEINGNGKTPATGTISVPEVHAMGEVRFTNLTQSPVRIPEGTIVRTVVNPVVRFYVTSAGELSAGVGKSLLLPVKSVEGGDEGNLPADALQSIEGSLGLSLSATNPEPTSGGKYVEKPSALEADKEGLLSEVGKSMLAQALDQMNKKLPPDSFLIENSLKVEQVSAIFNPSLDSPGSILSLDLKQKYKAYYLKSDDMNRLSELVLDSTKPAGFQPVAGSMTTKPIGDPLLGEDGKIDWEIRADRSISATIDQWDVFSQVLGQTVRGAENNLTQMENGKLSEITLSPSWWFLMPSLPVRIIIEQGQ